MLCSPQGWRSFEDAEGERHVTELKILGHRYNVRGRFASSSLVQEDDLPFLWIEKSTVLIVTSTPGATFTIDCIRIDIETSRMGHNVVAFSPCTKITR